MQRSPLLAPAFLLSCSMIALAGSAPKTSPSPTPAATEETSFEQYLREMTTPAHLVIVGTSKDFPALKRDAERIAQRLGRPFSMEGLVYDAKQGLHATGEDDGFTGYFHRRYDTDLAGKPFLSIEKSETYPGLQPGFYIIVARICSTPAEARRELAQCKRVVPDAYSKRTEIYYGCIH